MWDVEEITSKGFPQRAVVGLVLSYYHSFGMDVLLSSEYGPSIGFFSHVAYS
jgi:hypothetical protein